MFWVVMQSCLLKSYLLSGYICFAVCLQKLGGLITHCPYDSHAVTINIFVT